MSSSLGLGQVKDRLEAPQGPEKVLTDPRRLGRHTGAQNARQPPIGEWSAGGLGCEPPSAVL